MASARLRHSYPPQEIPNEEAAIKTFMQQLLSDYNTLRSGGSGDGQLVFWDLVAVSARDEEQKKAFELQISEKLSLNQLPKINYVVLADPENGKIGNGGSTLHVLEQLHIQFGDSLLEMRTLLIHAGGSSQRLPTASVLGKLFTPLPIGDPVYQMLDLKLAIYLPFLKRMGPGVLVTCSDDIETYWINDIDNDSFESVWSFEERGFVALAHRGDIETGTHHGVYVLPFVDFDTSAAVSFGECLQVLQKPTAEVMELKGAVIDGFGVCTDSVFYFSKDILRKFLDFYKSIKPLDCELDAYNDFLQALGINANMDYIHNARNKLAASKSLTNLRQKLYLLLHKIPLNVLLLHWSRFHHLGTNAEYISNLCNLPPTRNLYQDLGFANWTFSKRISQSNPSLHCDVTTNPRASLTVIHSIVDSVDSKGPGVIEYCDFRINLTVGEYCLLSYCSVEGASTVEVPSRTLLHTVPVNMGSKMGFSTIAFGIDDDLKADYSTLETNELKYFEKRISDLLPVFGVKNILELFDEKVERCSLWNAKLFPLKETSTESFLATLRQVLQIRGESDPVKKIAVTADGEATSLSMSDVIKYGDVERMLKRRKVLYQKINEK